MYVCTKFINDVFISSIAMLENHRVPDRLRKQHELLINIGCDGHSVLIFLGKWNPAASKLVEGRNKSIVQLDSAFFLKDIDFGNCPKGLQK